MSKKEELTPLKKIYERLNEDGKVTTQVDMATKVGYDKSPFSRMIKGVKPIPYTLLEALYNQFDVNANYIVSKGKGNMFLTDTEKVTRKDLELSKELKDHVDHLQNENQVLKKMIADKDLIIELFQKNKKA